MSRKRYRELGYLEVMETVRPTRMLELSRQRKEWLRVIQEIRQRSLTLGGCDGVEYVVEGVGNDAAEIGVASHTCSQRETHTETARQERKESLCEENKKRTGQQGTR